MQLVGSRASNNNDEFSDWDFKVDSADDFEAIANKLAIASAWSTTKRENFYILTVLDQDGMMWDYSGEYERFAAEWTKLGSPDNANRAIYDYWILTFKQLKGLYRGFDEFVSLGIEMSTGLARDIYLQRRYDISNYKNFFAYAKVAPLIVADKKLTATTGLAYETVAEKLAKISALNELVASVSADIAAGAKAAYDLQVKAITRA